jgi:hypothetical protein
VLHKKASKNPSSGVVNEENPLEISLFLVKTDTAVFLKELLVRMLAHSFIQQHYEFHFRMREQTLFEDILADEFVKSTVALAVMGRKISRANCAQALDQAVEQTVYRLSQKNSRGKLVDMLYSFLQGDPKNRQERDILATREELVSKLLKLLPETITDQQN